METLLEWTLSRKVDRICREPVASLIVESLVNCERPISDLWSSDVLGIHEPCEKKAKMKIDNATQLITVEHLNDRRYQVTLLWTEGHPASPSNLNIAKKRLENLDIKLKKENLIETYDAVFQECWLKELSREYRKKKQMVQLTICLRGMW